SQIKMENEQNEVGAFFIKIRMYLLVMDYTIIKYSPSMLIAEKKEKNSKQCESIRAAAFSDKSAVAISKVYKDKNDKESNHYVIMELDTPIDSILEFINWVPIQHAN